MRYNFVMVLMFICGTQAFSQRFEVGPFLGGANYIGDVGRSTYVQPKSPVFGGLVKWNRSARHAYRFSLLHAQIEADDSNSPDTRRQQRGYSFTNNITEASLGIEYTFWEWDLSSGVYQSTPYLYTGISYYYSRHFKLIYPAYVPPPSGGNRLEQAGNNWEFSIPMVMGYKQTFNTWLSGGLEIGARFTFTDNLDGSHPSEVDGNFQPYDFGNSNTSDWYVFTGIYLTFNFGRNPCYTHF